MRSVIGAGSCAYVMCEGSVGFAFSGSAPIGCRPVPSWSFWCGPLSVGALSRKVVIAYGRKLALPLPGGAAWSAEVVKMLLDEVDGGVGWVCDEHCRQQWVGRSPGFGVPFEPEKTLSNRRCL